MLTTTGLRRLAHGLAAVAAGLLVATTLAAIEQATGLPITGAGPLAATQVIAEPDPCARWNRRWLSRKVCPPPEHYWA